MLIGGILLGLLLGLRAGGRITNLAQVQLRWVWVLAAAVIVRIGTEALLNAEVPLVELLRVPLLGLGFGLLLIGLWVNRGYPGMSLAFIGILLNAVVILINGGFMPIWAPALETAGFTEADVTSALHVVVSGDNAVDFLLRGLILGDIIPIPIPLVRDVASLGDLFLTIGLAFFLFASVMRVPPEIDEREAEVARQRLTGLAGAARLPRADGAARVAPETGLAPALQDVVGLERPLVLGAQGAGLASPALAPLPAAPPERARRTDAALDGSPTSAGTIPPPLTIPRPTGETVERVRQHPYVRLALNGSFGALWAGQLISLFGDRIHQLALVGVVYYTTGSPLASALVFVAAFIPNLLFSPLAGTLVDRWDHKEVLVVSDLLRAAGVLLIPMAVVTNVLLVYPLVFLITSISIFFRPARVAILPRIVRREDLLTANSALWVGETMADVVGYPVATLFVVALGAALPLAFWLDAATYVASAALLATIVIKPKGEVDEEESAEDGSAPAAVPDTVDDGSSGGFIGELKAGYRFLRHEPTLLANTIQAAVAQPTVGVLTALVLPMAQGSFGSSGISPLGAVGLIETGVGAGNLIGGFVIGLIGARFAKGRMIIAGYAIFGLFTALLALSGNLPLAFGLAFGSGVSNMLFVIPSQTMFQERTPPNLMGRVVGFRFALVYGSMTLATAFGGLLAVAVGAGTVIAVFGFLTMLTGLAGLLVPAVRDA